MRTRVIRGDRLTKLSVIVPVYKVETYIRECILSIQNQTIKDIEIIVINDGTPDRSIEKITDLAFSDKRIKIVNKLNEGVSSARNLGIMISQGEYISFVDADDKVEPHFLENLYGVAVVKNYEIVRGSFRDFSGKVLRGWVADAPEGQFTGLEFMRKVYIDKFSLAIWNGIYKKSFLKAHHILFIEKLTIGEDSAFWYDMAFYSKKIYCINFTDYRYRIRPGSALTSNDYSGEAQNSKEKIISLFKKMALETEMEKKLLLAYCVENAINDWVRQVWKHDVIVTERDYKNIAKIKKEINTAYIHDKYTIKIIKKIKWIIIFIRLKIRDNL